MSDPDDKPTPTAAESDAALQNAYAQLVEKAGDMIVIIQEGQFVYRNIAAQKTLADPASGAWAEAVDPVYREAALANYAAHINGQPAPARYELDLLGVNGKFITVEASPQRIEFRGQPAVMSILRDVSERKRLQNKLADSERTFRTIFEQSSDGIAIIQDGLLAFSNPAAVSITGYEAGKGTPWINLIAPEEREHVLAMDQARRSGGGDAADRYIVTLVTATGRRIVAEIAPRNIDFGGQPATLTLIRDITEANAAERELRASEERLRNAQRLAKVTTWRWDAASDHVEMFHHDPDNAIIRLTDDAPLYQIIESVHPDDRARLTKEIAAAIKQQRHFVNEFRILNDLPEPTTIKVWAELDRDNNKQVTSIQGALQDVTELRAAEAALLQSEAQLRHGQKMEAMGKLAGGIAHDFNNLLTVINGYSELLAATLPVGERSRESAAEILEAGKRASDLTRQLLTFSRQQMVTPEPLQLNELITGITKMLGRLISADIIIYTELAESLPFIKADSAQMEQVIVNLAVNAQDAMPEGGTLIITTRPETANGEDNVILEVRDTGYGIDPSLQEHLFEPFFTTKDTSSGSGLGLAAVYGIISQSGGTIEIQSTPGEGATFIITLPATEETPTTNEPTPVVPISDPEGAETILLVEDEPMVKEYIGAILRRAGYRVLLAENSNQAMDRLEEHHAKVDLLLTDIIMPGTDGVTLVEQMQTKSPDLAVIYMSGYTGFANARQNSIPQDRFLQKPFSKDALLRLVRIALNDRETFSK